MDNSLNPKLLDILDISNEDFINASSYSPVMNTPNTHVTHRSAFNWLRAACCGTTAHARFSNAEDQTCADEVLREAKGQGQVCVRVNSELFAASGSICLLGPATDFSSGSKFFFLTCAHNFIHFRDDNQRNGTRTEGMEEEAGNEAVHCATAAVFHYSKLGPENYAVKAQVLDFRTHPKFLDGPSSCAGFDIAVGLLTGNFEKAPRCENSYWSYFEYQAPLRIGDEICVVGYPAEKAGYAYNMSGTISGILDVANGGKLLVSLYGVI
jgi:hypothetical protein